MVVIGCMKPCNDFVFYGRVFLITQFLAHESFPFCKTKASIMVSVELAEGSFDFIDLLLREWCLFKIVN